MFIHLGDVEGDEDYIGGCRRLSRSILCVEIMTFFQNFLEKKNLI